MVKSVHITTIVVSSNPVHGEVYLVQQYAIKIVSDLRQVNSFLRVLRFLPPLATDLHDIAEILSKVVVNTITLSRNIKSNCFSFRKSNTIYRNIL
jgi:hypothetical protein